MNCPYCDKPAMWVDNNQIYGRNYGKSYKVWLCKSCNAYVGCHNNTKRPLGTMANEELRKMRIQAHVYIDDYWQKGLHTRKKVYQLLKEHFGKEIHIGSADIKLCQEICEGADHILESK